MAVQGDAALLPLASASVDIVVCTLVSHHLNEEVLHRVVQQCWRVLKPSGLFLFADAVRRPDRWLSRLMWSLDRGAYPHDMDCLRNVLSKGFEPLHVEQFTGYHEYAIMVLRKSAKPAVSPL
jgi:SAM-dependent methyltransferase